MFIQVIRGRVMDAEAVFAASDRWAKELKPGAKGYLGSTEGVTDDGQYVCVVRFDSEADARRNSDRPEQGTWWAEASKAFAGEVTFYDCPDVEVFAKGGSDDAGFVQLMVYRTTKADEIRQLGKQFESMMSFRPDIIGGTTAFTADGTVIDTNYFTSEKAAREGESKDLPAELKDAMARFGELAGDVEFIDLRNPRMDSA